MADIATTDVTAKRLFVTKLGGGVAEGGPPLLMVGLRITVNPGTDDTYEGGAADGDAGVPLEVLFTTGNASDCYLDTAQPITQMGLATARLTLADESVALIGEYSQQGVTAGAQRLILWTGQADGGTNPIAPLSQLDEAMDVTGAEGFNADAAFTVDIVLVGRLRPGVTPSGVILN